MKMEAVRWKGEDGDDEKGVKNNDMEEKKVWRHSERPLTATKNTRSEWDIVGRFRGRENYKKKRRERSKGLLKETYIGEKTMEKQTI